MTRTSAPPSSDDSSLTWLPSMAWYFGAANLSLRGRFTHSWMPWNTPPLSTSSAGGVSMCRMPEPGRHPLRGAVGDQAAAAVRILVREAAVDHVGDGFEAAVRMPVGAPRLARLVFDLAHLVHVDERVEVGGADAGECAHDGEALALVAARAGGDGADRAVRCRRPRARRSAAVSGVSGDSRHGTSGP